MTVVVVGGGAAGASVAARARRLDEEAQIVVLERARLLGVRAAEEFALWHVPGAQNVPLGELRAACEDGDRDQPVRLYCAVGFRSYLAYRALVQRGFTDVATLSGGRRPSAPGTTWSPPSPALFSALVTAES